MRVYKLVPIQAKLDHLNWNASTHRTPCFVRALSEESARDIAQGCFVIAVERKYLGQPIAFCPWKYAEFVECIEVDDTNLPSLGDDELLSSDGMIYKDYDVVRVAA